MATAAVLPPRDVPTTLNYHGQSSDEVPYSYVHSPPEGKPKTNVSPEPHDVVIHDVRGKEGTVSLDKTGFQFVKHSSTLKEFVDDEVIREKYYPEVEELLKTQTGAKRVFIFDHTVRHTIAEESRGPNGMLIRGAADRVHIDQTFDASVARVHHHLPEEAERLLKSRVRLINVWRPIANPVAHKPLALADWRTLNTADGLVPIQLIYPDRVGGVFGVKWNPALQWYYLSGQTPDEVTLIKCYDSETNVARLTPHTAFLDTGSPAEAPQRRSIEIRALVFDSE